jgi:hypothetical protein
MDPQKDIAPMVQHREMQLQQHLDFFISATPTGEKRNILCDMNILLQSYYQAKRNGN